MATIFSLQAKNQQRQKIDWTFTPGALLASASSCVTGSNDTLTNL